MVGERGQIEIGIAEMLIQRIQAAGYELQRSLPLVTDSDVISHIDEAVEHLNEAIKTIQFASARFDLPTP